MTSLLLMFAFAACADSMVAPDANGLNLSVTPVSSGVTVTPSLASLVQDETVQLTESTNGKAQWSSDAPSIASVSSSGMVTGEAPGTATITARHGNRWGTAVITVTASGSNPPPANPSPPIRDGFYVAPDGGPGGDGSWEMPWDLTTALQHPGAVQPGDTIWIRGGLYRGPFVSILTGTAAQPIVLRAYPGERAILDNVSTSQVSLRAAGQWTWYWGLEVQNSNPDRTTDRTNCVYPSRANNKFINLILHDCSVGMSFINESRNSELYGSIIYNNGWTGPDRTHGHGIYTKNDGTTTKVIRDNVVFNSFRNGIQLYTDAGSGQLKGYVMEGNVFFNNGVLTSNDNSAANMLLGGKEIVDDVVVRENMTYFSPSVLNRSVRIGYNNTLRNGTLEFTRNYIVGQGTLLEVGLWTQLTVNNNFVAGARTVASVRESSYGGYSWGGNTHNRDPAATAWRDSGGTKNFTQWRNGTGLGATDQAMAGTPTASQIFVRKNAYEAGRAHVIVYNWARQGSVLVDLTGVLQQGAHYEIRNVQDLWGAPVVSGTYSGGSVAVPMSGVAPPAPIGGAPNTAPRTGPDFDVFLVTTLN